MKSQLNNYTEEPGPWRHLAAAVLLAACADAAEGSGQAARFIQSDQARHWAELVDLPDWPPAAAQLASLKVLRQRANYLNAAEPEPEDAGGIGLVAMERTRRRQKAASEPAGKAAPDAAPEPAAAALDLWQGLVGKPLGEKAAQRARAIRLAVRGEISEEELVRRQAELAAV